MAIFNSYVKLPEGTMLVEPCLSLSSHVFSGLTLVLSSIVLNKFHIIGCTSQEYSTILYIPIIVGFISPLLLVIPIV